MKRSAFIGSLLGMVGLGRAQMPLGTHAEGWLRPWQENKPKNNQCPVCGSMAVPRKFTQGISKVVPCANENPYVSCTMPMFHDPGPGITRCNRCNAAFWQDAER